MHGTIESSYLRWWFILYLVNLFIITLLHISVQYISILSNAAILSYIKSDLLCNTNFLSINLFILVQSQTSFCNNYFQSIANILMFFFQLHQKSAVYCTCFINDTWTIIFYTKRDGNQWSTQSDKKITWNVISDINASRNSMISNKSYFYLTMAV